MYTCHVLSQIRGNETEAHVVIAACTSAIRSHMHTVRHADRQLQCIAAAHDIDMGGVPSPSPRKHAGRSKEKESYSVHVHDCIQHATRAVCGIFGIYGGGWQPAKINNHLEHPLPRSSSCKSKFTMLSLTTQTFSAVTHIHHVLKMGSHAQIPARSRLQSIQDISISVARLYGDTSE